MSGKRPLICIGHRGAMGYKPENTLSSFALAIDMGCPWIELDVYVVDDEVIVIHDDTLERTTNGTGRVIDRSFEYLRGLDAGDGQQIPTLQEVIELVDRRAGINVELKGKHTASAVSRILADCVKRGWSAEAFVVSSFAHRELAAADPAFRRGALFGSKSRRDYFAVTDRLKAWSLNLGLSLAQPQTIAAAHERGLEVFVYTVNKPEDIARMRALGVDGVFTNYPDRVLES